MRPSSAVTGSTGQTQADTLTLAGTLEDGDVYRIEIDGNIITHTVDTASDTSLAVLAQNIAQDLNDLVTSLAGSPPSETTYAGTPPDPQVSSVTISTSVVVGDGVSLVIDGQTISATTASGLQRKKPFSSMILIRWSNY